MEIEKLEINELLYMSYGGFLIGAICVLKKNGVFPKLIGKGNSIYDIARITNFSVKRLKTLIDGLVASKVLKICTKTKSVDFGALLSCYSHKDIFDYACLCEHLTLGSYFDAFMDINDLNSESRVDAREYYKNIMSNKNNIDNFLKVTSRFNKIVMPKIINKIQLPKKSRVIDLGSGDQILAEELIKKNPKVSLHCFDLSGLMFRNRNIETIEGDLFSYNFDPYNYYLLKNILHDWNDVDCLKILKNLVKNAPKDACFIIIEAGSGEISPLEFHKWRNITREAFTGGKERNKSEFENLFSKVGLRIENIKKIIVGIVFEIHIYEVRFL